MGNDRANATHTGSVRGLANVEPRHTFSTRLFGTASGFDWNVEIALQSGIFRGRDIRADMRAGFAGYTIGGVAWAPRTGLESNYAGGDNTHSSAIGTFNAMYLRLPYFAETSLLVPASIYDIRWRIDQHRLLDAIAAEFISGPAVQQALGKTVTFLALFATYRF